MSTNHHNHLSDEELVKYVNSKDEMQDADIQKVERHLYIAGCSECKAKVNELERLNHAFSSKIADVSKEEGPDLCSWSEKIVDFVYKRLNSMEREQFMNHIADCDECRKATALLASAMSSKTAGKSADTKPKVWDSVRDGMVRLSKAISLSGEGAGNSIFTPSMEIAEGKFRGPEDERSNNKKSIEINLPENSGNIKLIYFEQPGRYGKMVIEPSGAIHGEMRIEVYDKNNSLLKSIDGSKSVSCLVKKGGYTIRVNSRFEIPISLG